MIIEQARSKIIEITEKLNIHENEIKITCRTLTPEEAIGNPLHDDYPIQLGVERIIEAEFMGKKGQAFSDSYFNYTGKVGAILNLNLESNSRRAIFISSLNAILAHLDIIPEAIHCKNDDLVKCGNCFSEFLKKQNLNTDNVLLVGLQPRLLEKLAAVKNVRVCDLDPEMIGTVKYGVTIDGPQKFSENAAWAGTIFATGSTVVNGSIDGILKANSDTYFYGVTIAGVAKLLGLKQYCYILGID